jgi:hypothetical protein
MKTLHTTLRAATLALLAAGATASAHAQASTGSLVGWNAHGDAIAQAGAITLTTAYLDGFTDQPYNLSGQSAEDIGVIEAAAGLPAYALDLGDTEYGTEGSLVGQSFAVSAGQTLSFTWSFSTHEDLFLDHAFVVVDGQLFTLATRAQPGLASQTFSYSFGHGGMATLALGVIDTGDYLGVSSLTVGNLQISAVPEPAAAVLLLAGLGLVGAAARRRR